VKLLYIGRQFSGLRTSLVSGRWQPTGVPTIYRMIEAFAARTDQFHLLLVDKDRRQDDAVCETRLAGLDCPVTLLGLPAWVRRIGSSAIGEIWQTVAVLRQARRQAPDIIYIDHANTLAAGILARFSHRRVVYRIMGVYPFMRDVMHGTGVRNRLFRWAYRQPYDLAICTQDGSGVEPWLSAALDPAVPVQVMVNGVDKSIAEAALPDEVEDFRATLPSGSTLVLFLGKVEPAKGVAEFVEGMARAIQQGDGRIHGLIVGTGSLDAAIDARLAELGLTDRIRRVRALPHRSVLAVFRQADIYVSMNRLGNLSNANLEAIVSGCCMIIPDSQPQSGIDIFTDALLPQHAVLRFGPVEEVGALGEALAALCADPQRREGMRAATKAASAALPSWDERIGHEFDLVTALLDGAAR